jgi:hypothetical protein
MPLEANAGLEFWTHAGQITVSGRIALDQEAHGRKLLPLAHTARRRQADASLRPKTENLATTPKKEGR